MFFVYRVPGPQVESWHYTQSDDNKLIRYQKKARFRKSNGCFSLRKLDIGKSLWSFWFENA